MKQLPEKMSLKQGPGLFREVESCLQSDRPRVVLDCSKIRQLDSAGIHALLRCLEAAMKRNGDVKLASVPPAAAAILELTRVDRLFEAFDSTADAVNSFHGFQRRPYQQATEHAHSTLLRRGRHSSFENSQFDLSERPAASDAIAKTSSRLRRQIIGSLVLLLITPFAAAVPRPQQEATPSQQVSTSSPAAAQAQSRDSAGAAKKADAEASQPDALPNSPGTVRSEAGNTDPSSAQRPSPVQQSTQEPLGTAAAPPLKTTGVAASSPAGAAIAPAKQRRARSILIKVGAIVGAGVAVGAVVALSKASPSRPPASR